MAAIFAAVASPASALTRWVNADGVPTPPGTSCTKPGYNKIQAAVDAAASGDVINVCPGTYPEQVTVETAAKSNIVLRSTTPLAARIQAPPAMELVNGDLVRIDNGARNVSLLAFTVAGPLPDTLFCAAQLRAGVRVKGGASALIAGNYITEIRSANPALRGCQNGFGVAVGRTFDFPVPDQVGQAVIFGNRIDRYQKGGLYADNKGTSVSVRNNSIEGDGPTNVIAQNGVQVSRGATAELRGNTIKNHAYVIPAQPCIPDATCVTATGVLLFELDGNVAVEDNELRRNQDGVGLYTTTNLRVKSNSIIGGIPGFGPAFACCSFGDGIFADSDTSGNRIEGNFLRDNVEHDCHDDSGPTRQTVRNIWRDNDGRTSQPAGLCRADDRGDDDHGHHGGRHGDKD